MYFYCGRNDNTVSRTLNVVTFKNLSNKAFNSFGNIYFSITLKVEKFWSGGRF